ncbi:Retrovirus-related Pol polyprotein from transposon 412 [Eumeta japonica]|uniref:RNA-directed DNA polymerase n=1 Tax=Eumeta variegata TaxID=151549 RepID=A0A4C1VGK9_EUMVA|nr:Retrovirus-related Pol polyprotein from transposon 412 [Eumeta japonica]
MEPGPSGATAKFLTTKPPQLYYIINVCAECLGKIDVETVMLRAVWFEGRRSDQIERGMLRWFGHLERMKESRLTKQIYTANRLILITGEFTRRANEDGTGLRYSIGDNARRQSPTRMDSVCMCIECTEPRDIKRKIVREFVPPVPKHSLPQNLKSYWKSSTKGTGLLSHCQLNQQSRTTCATNCNHQVVSATAVTAHYHTYKNDCTNIVSESIEDRPLKFLIDTGASISIIKIETLHPETKVSTKEILNLKGISDSEKPMKTLETQLKLQPDKCEFMRHEVAYLGHIINKDGVSPDPNKIKVIENFPIPQNQKEIKSFLGLVGYYRRFIENFSKLTKPLTKLLKKDIRFNWTEEQQKSFDLMRKILTSPKILQYPDFSKPFILTTDASNYAIGAILSQGEIGQDLPIAYASRTLNNAEGNYSTTEKELVAIKWAVQHFRPYLYGRKFKIVTDHRPLTWLFNVKDPGSKLIRWRLQLEEFDYEIIHKPGKINSNVDCLSRIPIRNITVDKSETYNDFQNFFLEQKEFIMHNFSETDEPLFSKNHKCIAYPVSVNLEDDNPFLTEALENSDDFNILISQPQLEQITSSFKCTNRVNNIEKSIEKLYKLYGSLSHLTATKRMKRGWFDGIGSLMKTVFGTLDSDDAVYYDESIEKQQERQSCCIQVYNQCFARTRSRVEPTIEMTVQNAAYDERSDSPTLETPLRKIKRNPSTESGPIPARIESNLPPLAVPGPFTLGEISKMPNIL